MSYTNPSNPMIVMIFGKNWSQLLHWEFVVNRSSTAFGHTALRAESQQQKEVPPAITWRCFRLLPWEVSTLDQNQCRLRPWQSKSGSEYVRAPPQVRSRLWWHVIHWFLLIVHLLLFFHSSFLVVWIDRASMKITKRQSNSQKTIREWIEHGRIMKHLQTRYPLVN